MVFSSYRQTSFENTTIQNIFAVPTFSLAEIRQLRLKRRVEDTRVDKSKSFNDIFPVLTLREFLMLTLTLNEIQKSKNETTKQTGIYIESKLPSIYKEYFKIEVEKVRIFRFFFCKFI